MSKALQQPSSNGGYSSPRNLEHRLQMLPLASAGSHLTSIMDKQLLALPALQLPPPGSKTLPPSISSSSITKPHFPALPLAALPAPPTDTTSEAAPPAAQQPLPVVAYKPKPKPVETAFGYRVPSGGTKQSSSRSGSAGKSSILDSSCGSAAVTPRDDKAAGSNSRAGLSREGSMVMGPLSLPDSRRGSSAGQSGRFFDVGGSKVPLSPRTGQKKAEAFDSNSSGSSKIPKPWGAPPKAGGRHNSSNSGTSSSKARSYRASAAQDAEEKIFLDCDGSEPTHTGGQSKPVSFTLSCAINAVFNVTGGSSGSGGSGGGIEASSLIQTMGAALNRSIMSATQQHAGSHAQQREPVRGPSRPSSPARSNRHSSNGNSSYHTPKQAAGSPSTGRSSRGSVSAGSTGSGGARSWAQSGGSTPTTKALQILPATSNFRAVGGDSAGAASTAAGSAAQTATTIFMQLQGNAAGQHQPASSRGVSLPTGSGYDSSTFYSCAASEATSGACSEAGSDKGGAQQQQQLLAPRSRAFKAAGPSILDPSSGLSLATHTTGTDGELVRYVSANTAASWTTSDVGEIMSVEEDSEQQPKQAQQQQQQQQLKAGTSSMLHSSTPESFERSLLELEQTLQSLEATAAAAAAAAGIETATNAAFAGKAAAADAHEREVVLTITPKALPFLAARAFSQTPVRLVITQDAVWGDLAAFTAAAAGEDSSSSAAGGGAEGQTKKKEKKAGLFSRRSSRSSKC